MPPKNNLTENKIDALQNIDLETCFKVPMPINILNIPDPITRFVLYEVLMTVRKTETTISVKIGKRTYSCTLKPNQALLQVRKLARELGVSRQRIRLSVDSLCGKGYPNSTNMLMNKGNPFLQPTTPIFTTHKSFPYGSVITVDRAENICTITHNSTFHNPQGIAISPVFLTHPDPYRLSCKDRKLMSYRDTRSSTEGVASWDAKAASDSQESSSAKALEGFRSTDSATPNPKEALRKREQKPHGEQGYEERASTRSSNQTHSPYHKDYSESTYGEQTPEKLVHIYRKHISAKGLANGTKSKARAISSIEALQGQYGYDEILGAIWKAKSDGYSYDLQTFLGGKFKDYLNFELKTTSNIPKKRTEMGQEQVLGSKYSEYTSPPNSVDFEAHWKRFYENLKPDMQKFERRRHEIIKLRLSLQGINYNIPNFLKQFPIEGGELPSLHQLKNQNERTI